MRTTTLFSFKRLRPVSLLLCAVMLFCTLPTEVRAKDAGEAEPIYLEGDAVRILAPEKIFAGNAYQLSAELPPSCLGGPCVWSAAGAGTVDGNGLLSANETGSVTVTLTTADGQSDSLTLTVLQPIESLSRHDSCESVFIGLTATFSVETDPMKYGKDSVKWVSSDPSVLEIKSTYSKIGRAYLIGVEHYSFGDVYVYDNYTYPACDVTGLKRGTATLSAVTASGRSLDFTVQVLKPASELTLDKETLPMTAGQTKTLKAAFFPSDADDAITWRSSAPSVADVSADGTVTARSGGTAVITVRTRSSLEKSCTVTVTVPAEGILLSDGTLTLRRGESRRLTASLSPSNSTDAVDWSSSDGSVLSVSPEGVVTGLRPGSATITAVASSGAKATCEVSVVIPSEAIVIRPATVSVCAGKTVALNAMLSPADSTDAIEWSNDDDTVAAVDGNGIVMGKSAGTATVTARTESGKLASCRVTVLVPSAAVELDQTAAAVNVGETLTLTAVLTPENTTDTVQWKSSNATIAAVSSPGEVTAVAPGTATITAKTTSGLTAACEITVLLPSESITLTADTLILAAGESDVLTAELFPKETTDEITWSSSDPAAATVSGDGTVTGVAQGSARITAETTGGKTASCTVTVFRRADAIKLDRREAQTAILGDTFTLQATVEPADATYKTIEWASSDDTVAEVSPSGEVTVLSEGRAEITATNAEGLIRETCTVTVVSTPSGDVNNDGILSPADARLCLRRSVGLETYAETSREYLSCDVDGSAGVTSADARIILRAAVGLETLSTPLHYHVYGAEVRTEPTRETAAGIVKTCRICGGKTETEP